MTTYQGVLTFHSETGTEGGAWAFQDEQFMNLPAPPQFRCTRCGCVWDKDHELKQPPPTFTYWREKRSAGAQLISSGYYASKVYLPHGDLGPDENTIRTTNEAARQCVKDGHGEWEHMYPHGMWSYEGLHILHEGDELIVWDGETILFRGAVKLPPEQDTASPPEGTNEDWWFEEKQATLKTP